MKGLSIGDRVIILKNNRGELEKMKLTGEIASFVQGDKILVKLDKPMLVKAIVCYPENVQKI